MKKRFLYRSTLRIETLTKKEKRFHKIGMRSSRMRLPLLGALGRISSAGTLSSSYRQVK